MTTLTDLDLFKIAEPTYPVCGRPEQCRWLDVFDGSFVWTGGTTYTTELPAPVAAALHGWHWVQKLNEWGYGLVPEPAMSGTWAIVKIWDGEIIENAKLITAPTHLEAYAQAVVIVGDTNVPADEP